MKKYLPYIIIILLLGGAATWFIVTKTSGTTDKEEAAFAVENGKNISKIVLTDTEKKRVELTLISGVWMVNGKYAAREDMIRDLLAVVTRLTSLCPVPRAAHDNVIRELMAGNIKAEIYTGNSQTPEKAYYVGGPAPDGVNTYMLLEIGGKPVARPHMTYMPGLKGYLTHRYNTDEETWRTRVVFNYKPEEIKSLSVEYPADKKQSFTINQIAQDSFALLPAEEKFAIKESYQQKYIRQYLDFYSSIYLEAFDNNNKRKDSLTQTSPFCIITITETDNSVNKVRLFRMPLNKKSKMQMDERGEDMPYDIDHFYASIHDDKDFVVVQYYVFGKLLRNYKDFFFKPSEK